VRWHGPLQDLIKKAHDETKEIRATVSRQFSVKADTPDPSPIQRAPEKKEARTGGTP